MQFINEITIKISQVQNELDIFDCFLHSACTLKAKAIEEIGLNNLGRSVGFPGNDYWNDHLITVFYLLRHTLEIAVKGLINELTKKEVHGHNLEKLYMELKGALDILIQNGTLSSYSSFDSKINEAFILLKKFHCLFSEELFRYAKDKKGVCLKDLPVIEIEEFTILENVCCQVRQAILVIKQLKIEGRMN